MDELFEIAAEEKGGAPEGSGGWHEVTPETPAVISQGATLQPVQKSEEPVASDRGQEPATVPLEGGWVSVNPKPVEKVHADAPEKGA